MGRLAREEAPALHVARSKGSFIFDTRGRKYIDFTSGWCVGNFGWGRPEAERALRSFRGPEYVYPPYGYRPWEDLAALFLSLAPGRLARCFRATGGSEAVDLALQAAMLHTGRRALMSLKGAYHGNAIGGLSVGEGRFLPACYKVRPPLDERAVGVIETRLKRRDVAAFILEPVSINLGVVAAEKPALRKVQALCRRYGTLLIADEVACGFGRTGRLFACEHYGLSPDLMCVAKAVTAGVGAMGAVLVTAPVARSMEKNGTFWSTYGWHPRSVAAAIATLRWVRRERRGLLDHVAELSALFNERLSRLPHDDLRVQGLAIAVDTGPRAGRIEERCRRKGLLLTAEENTVLLLPPLTLERRVAERGLDILERCWS